VGRGDPPSRRRCGVLEDPRTRSNAERCEVSNLAFGHRYFAADAASCRLLEQTATLGEGDPQTISGDRANGIAVSDHAQLMRGRDVGEPDLFGITTGATASPEEGQQRGSHDRDEDQPTDAHDDRANYLPNWNK